MGEQQAAAIVAADMIPIDTLTDHNQLAETQTQCAGQGLVPAIANR